MLSRETEILERLSKAVFNGDEDAVKRAAEDAIKEGMDPVRAINEGLVKGVRIVGEKFHKFEIFLPEVMLAADAMKAGMAILRSKIAAGNMAGLSQGKVVIGTVFGDIHDIGKNLVAAMLEVSGFEVSNLGSDCPNEKFIDKAEESGAHIIAMSSLMATTMFYQKDVINYLKDAGLRRKYWVMVGGGTVTPEWTTEIGADGYGRNATDAVEVAKMLMEKGEELKKPIIKE